MFNGTLAHCALLKIHSRHISEKLELGTVQQFLESAASCQQLALCPWVHHLPSMYLYPHFTHGDTTSLTMGAWPERYKI